jgi:glycosyltransferase involved in cell wall biosynthesis
MPVYNGERFVDSAIRSIRAQTFADFELVISDNASADATLEIAREHERDDERIRVVANDVNRGAAWNYNRVFDDCTSPYFKWAAADDELAPTCVERSLEALEAAGPDVVLVFPATRYIDEHGAELRVVHDRLETSPSDPPYRRFRHVVANATLGNLAFALMRSDALRKTRGHGAYPSADMVLFAELALVGAFRFLPEPLFLRRDHAGMSRRAHTTVEDVTSFFDPNGAAPRHELTRLFVEHLRAIAAVPISRRERALAVAVLVPTWVRRHDEVRARAARAHRRLRRGLQR